MDDDQLWRWAARAIERFGATAVAYDRFRPGYPEAAFDYLADRCGLGPGSVVVEVGAGTGVASLPLASRCSTLVCLEPAAGMAELARVKLAPFAGATVVESTFEDWEPTVAGADLMAAANAWLWVDPAVRWAKAAALLRPGGHLALLWHDLLGYEPAGFAARLAEVGGALNPKLAAAPADLGLDDLDTWAARSGASGRFDEATTVRYSFSRPLDGPMFVAVLNTYGVNVGLDPATRRKLDQALVDLVDGEFDGRVVKHEDAVLHVARRRS